MDEKILNGMDGGEIYDASVFSCEFRNSFASEASGGAVEVVYTDGKVKKYDSLVALQSSEDFPSVLKSVESGDVLSVNIPVLAYADVPNKNSSRPTLSSLRKIASLAEGKPMLLDHNVYSSDNEVGVLGKTRLVSDRSIADGADSIVSNVSIRERSTMDSYLRGMRRRVSIRFEPDRYSLQCSCGQKYSYDRGYPQPKCGHYRGDRYEDAEGNKKIAELFYNATDIVELSFTPYPAVTQAGAIGNSLSKQREEKMDPEKKEEKVETEAKSQDKTDTVSADKYNALKEENKALVELVCSLSVDILKAERIVVAADDVAYAKSHLIGAATGLDGKFNRKGVEDAVAFFRRIKAPQAQFSGSQLGVDQPPPSGPAVQNSPSAPLLTVNGKPVASISQYNSALMGEGAK